ncbi:MAG: hypothetical protein LAT67_15670 [Balneolales bacterium]|nr:hypothetical protein [Balneolales bacterium]
MMNTSAVAQTIPGEEVVLPPPDTDQLSSAALFGVPLAIELESGAAWFTKNEVRIPGDIGTQFDFLDLIGTFPEPYLRLSLEFSPFERHQFRILFAPLQRSGTGFLQEDTFFEEQTFLADFQVDGTYRFSTYRFTWRYLFYQDDRTQLGAGLAALIRDAEVRLVQGDRNQSNTDLGIVPLIHLYGKFNFGSGLGTEADVEGLVSTQGRAIDGTVRLTYSFGNDWMAFAGFRMLDGGADNDRVYNFANIAYISTGIRFGF